MTENKLQSLASQLFKITNSDKPVETTLGTLLEHLSKIPPETIVHLAPSTHVKRGFYTQEEAGEKEVVGILATLSAYSIEHRK